MAELGEGGGSGYPAAIDTDATPETDNVTDARADVPNDLADAIIKIETKLGITGGTALLDSAVTVNNSEADKDFRVAATGATNALFVQGSDGFVGVGNATPSSPLDVTGNMELSSILFINETVNTKMTIGLTINIAANANEAFAIKGSEIAHGVTTMAETDTMFNIVPESSTAGGVRIQSFTEGAIGYRMRSIVTTETNTRSTSASGSFTFQSSLKDGTGLAQHSADKNMVAFLDHALARFVFDTDGEMHSDDIIGVGNDWDEWDDLALASDLSRLPGAKFNEMMKYKAQDFEKAGLLTLSVDEEGIEHAFIRHKAMLQFSMCCFSDIHDRFITVDDKLASYERAFEKISQKLGIPAQELLALGS